MKQESTTITTETPDNEPQSPLAQAVAKARGDILTEDDMKANIDFLNSAARRIKSGDASAEPGGLQLLIEFREHLNRRISELSTPESAPAPPVAEARTELPSQARMDQLIAISNQAACDESAEYVLAATLSGAADEAGLVPDGGDFETRHNQRKVFMGRVIEIIRERGLLSPQSNGPVDEDEQWTVRVPESQVTALEAERDALAQRLREVAAALKETAFSYHVEAEHKPAFAACANVFCSRACYTWNKLNEKDAALGETQ